MPKKGKFKSINGPTKWKQWSLVSEKPDSDVLDFYTLVVLVKFIICPKGLVIAPFRFICSKIFFEFVW